MPTAPPITRGPTLQVTASRVASCQNSPSRDPAQDNAELYTLSVECCDIACHWTVKRRYTDFEKLVADLRKEGFDISTKLPINSMRRSSSTAVGRRLSKEAEVHAQVHSKLMDEAGKYLEVDHARGQALVEGADAAGELMNEASRAADEAQAEELTASPERIALYCNALLAEEAALKSAAVASFFSLDSIWQGAAVSTQAATRIQDARRRSKRLEAGKLSGPNGRKVRRSLCSTLAELASSSPIKPNIAPPSPSQRLPERALARPAPAAGGAGICARAVRAEKRKQAPGIVGLGWRAALVLLLLLPIAIAWDLAVRRPNEPMQRPEVWCVSPMYGPC